MRPWRWIIFVVSICIALLGAVFAPHALASQLEYVSDTITDSRPSYPANHTILFKVPDAIPASGKIVIAFPNTPFLIGFGFVYGDVDLAYSTSSPNSGFVDRSLSASPDAVNDGVSLMPITGPITITLSSGSGIPAGAYVRILLGTNATYGGQGVHQITNPSSPASYHISFNTYDASNASLDYGSTVLVIMPAIAVDVNFNHTGPPVLSNGMPSGTIPSNVSGVMISFNTDTYAACRYATSPGVSYDLMTGAISADFSGIVQTFIVTGITKGTTYNYYIRCMDFAGNKNTTDYVISFTAGDPTGTGSGGGAYGSQTSGGGGGGGAPYPPGPAMPSLIIQGITFPSAQVSILQDGAILPQRGTADGNGNFTINIPSIPQGVYSFTLFINNSSGQRISARTFTMTIVAGTANSVVGLVMSPSLGLATSTVPPGGTVLISGQSAPLSTIGLWVTSQKELQSTVKVTTAASSTGSWSYALKTTGFSVDTYQVKAQASVPGLQVSDFSTIAFLGVGQKPVPQVANPDLNGDGKVNLIDFSILLFHWGQNYPPADFNFDGTVDLPDFSILLFHWTG